MTKLRTLALLLLVLSAAAGSADELKTLAGKPVSGTLVAITDSEITLRTDAGSVATPISQALLLDLRPVKGLPEGTKYTLVQLLDDTALRCKDVKFTAKEVELTLTSGAMIKLPLNTVTALLRDAQSDALAGQFRKLVKQQTRTDRVFILRDGVLNPLDGLLGEIDVEKQTVSFKREGAEAVALPLARLQGLTYHRTEPPAADAICRVIDQDGNTLVASKLAADGTTLTVTTTFGTKLSVKQADVARLDFNLGKLTFLSDLDMKVIPSPWLGGITPVRKDTNLDGNPITMQDRRFGKGLSMYAGTTLEYNLGGKYKELKAVLGADTRIAEEGQGEVTLEVYCDGERRLRQAVSAKDPRPIAVNVKDTNTLRIVVRGRNFTNYAGHATLAEARVSQ